LKFQLHGKKLQGGWMLVRTRRGSPGREQWLLFKERDEFAQAADRYDILEEQPLSAASGRDMEEIAANKRGRLWQSDRKSSRSEVAADPAPKQAKKRRAVKSAEKNGAGGKTRGKRRHASPRGPLKRLPSAIKPELATLVDKPPEGDQWLHEIKFD